jgi:hypothetical protein
MHHLSMMNLTDQMQILDRVLDLLNEKNIADKIDVRIEKALQLYSIIELGNCSSDEFKKIIASLYMRIYGKETMESTFNNEDEALKEAIWILEKYYKGNETAGYDGALFDATLNSSDGLQLVLERFIEIIKTKEQNKYITQTFNTLIDPSDWKLRYEITVDLVNRFKHLYSPELKNLPPIQLVSHLEELVINSVTASQVMRSILH